MAEITVNDFSGLKTALGDATSTLIKLGQDIIFNTAGGATVNRAKGDVTIDGQGFSITDYNSVGASDTIRYADSGSAAVTLMLQNIVWNGRNYYGIAYIPDSAQGQAITLALNNIHYTGPQAVHNRRGLTRVTDSEFMITRNGGPVSPQEFGEINRISFSGKVTIITDTVRSDALYSTIWFCNASSWMRVEENAELTVSAPASYMFYTDSAPPPAMTFFEGSKTTITTQTGLYYDAQYGHHTASSFTLRAGASFTATQSLRYWSIPFFKVRDSLTLEEGSSLYLAVPPSGTTSLMYFGNTASVKFNNPKSVVLYNNGGKVFSFETGSASAPNTININAGQLNMWKAAAPYFSAGGFDDIPASRFFKAGVANINAAVKASRTAVTSITSDLAAGDAGYPMSTANFDIFQAQVLSLGNIDLSVEQITDATVAVTGLTEPKANLRLSYPDTVINGTAGEDGSIDLPIPRVPAGTAAVFGANWKFLTKYIEPEVEGSVQITYLPALVFKSVFVPVSRSTVSRVDPGWYLEVTDTRPAGGAWYLYASLPLPLTKGSDGLADALAFKEGATAQIMSPDTMLIKQGEGTGPAPSVTRVTWSEAEGFLLKLVPGFSYNPGRYASMLRWELLPAPLPQP